MASGNIEQVLQVTPDSIEHTDIGLFLQSSSNFERYAELMLQNAQAFAQNQGQGIVAVSQIIKDIVSKASPESIHKSIMIQEQKMHEQQQQLQDQTAQHQQQLQQMQMEAQKAEQDFQLQLVREKAELDRQTRVEVATISALGFSKDTDVNDNQVPDVIELASHALKEKKLELDIKKQKDDVRLKEEELKIKNKVANKPKSSK